MFPDWDCTACLSFHGRWILQQFGVIVSVKDLNWPRSSPDSPVIQWSRQKLFRSSLIRMIYIISGLYACLRPWTHSADHLEPSSCSDGIKHSSSERLRVVWEGNIVVAEVWVQVWPAQGQRAEVWLRSGNRTFGCRNQDTHVAVSTAQNWTAAQSKTSWKNPSQETQTQRGNVSSFSTDKNQTILTVKMQIKEKTDKMCERKTASTCCK